MHDGTFLMYGTPDRLKCECICTTLDQNLVYVLKRMLFFYCTTLPVRLQIDNMYRCYVN
uniref:Uncharacterized protein n=1 Tax=Anguilla anguilla TaxID=7936 RepID=A0A0E9X339_ANGAN